MSRKDAFIFWAFKSIFSLFNPHALESFDVGVIKMQNTARCSFFLPCGGAFSVDMKGMRFHLSNKLINCRKISEF
jgi:hypothetical protein